MADKLSDAERCFARELRTIGNPKAACERAGLPLIAIPELLHNPRVLAEIERLNQLDTAPMDPADWIQCCREGLLDLATEPLASASARVKAYEVILKTIAGGFAPTEVHVAEVTEATGLSRAAADEINRRILGLGQADDAEPGDADTVH